MKNNKLEFIINKYRENKLAHAYLIETNDQAECIKDLLNVIKVINCNEEFTINCNKCNLCNLITLNNLPTLKIIEPEGQVIKKAQIQELKDNFSSKPIYSKYNIYIIRDADKLNAASANTMLKFLEEPEGQVLGFFLTSNKENILLTIQSRCQLIKANYELISTNSDNFEKELNIIGDYLYSIETQGISSILKNKKKIILELLENIKLEDLFKIILDIYKNAFYLKKEIIEKNEKYKNFNFLLEKSENNLQKKLNLIIEYLSNIKYNLNTELLLDKFVIEMSGINE